MRTMRYQFIALAMALLVAAPMAHAAVIDISGSYTIGDVVVSGIGNSSTLPTIDDDLTTPITNMALTVGGPATTAQNFITVNPTTTCDSSCSGGTNGTTESTITASFTFTEPSATNPVTISETAIYSATYSDSTDSVSWTGAVTNGTNCTAYTDHTGTGVDACYTMVVNFNDGAVMDVIFNDAEDWDITSTIAFEMVQGPRGVPEPASLAIFGTALIGYGVMRYRNKIAVI